MRRCFFFHDWSKWKFIGNWFKKGGNRRNIIAKQYERTCEACGKVQQETVGL